MSEFDKAMKALEEFDIELDQELKLLRISCAKSVLAMSPDTLSLVGQHGGIRVDTDGVTLAGNWKDPQ